MNQPRQGDYIDIHTHGSLESPGICAIENLMAHEGILPAELGSRPCTYGIHPWHLSEDLLTGLLRNVQSVAGSANLVAIGEAGFDKLRGPGMKIQQLAFEAQVKISEEVQKPLFIHCVRAWDELLPAYKRMRPKMPWMIHGFRGSSGLAQQLISKGIYLSLWFDFAMRAESSGLLRSLPPERIFLETDGADIDIRAIYGKVSADLDMEVDELKTVILNNYNTFFNSGR